MTKAKLLLCITSTRYQVPGTEYRPTNEKAPNKNERLAFWTRLRNCPYESELVLATQISKGHTRKSNMQAELK